MAELRLLVGTRAYGGWESVRLVRSLEQLAATFEVSGTERWSHAAAPLPVPVGAAVRVELDGEVVLTGWVDDVELAHDGAQQSLTLAGRCRTADLVDCSVERRGGQWKNRSLEQIANDVCGPFKVSVKTSPAVAAEVRAPFRRFAAEEGETAFDCLERAARARGVILQATGGGDLLLTRPDATSIGTALVTGSNVLSASRTGSHRERYSTITVKGQAVGDDQNFGEVVAARSASTTDPRVERYRPLVLLAEAPGEDLKARAEWERNVRYGRSLRVSVTVAGWRHSDGIWTPGQLVRMRDRYLHVDADLLVASVALTLDAGDELTVLDLVRPEAFSLAALPSAAQEKREWYDAPATGWRPQ